MNLTVPQEAVLLSLISEHHGIITDNMSGERLNRMRAIMVSQARAGTLTHENSLVVADFGVAMLEPPK